MAGARGSVYVRLRRMMIAVVGVGVLALGLVLVVVPVPGTSIAVLGLGLAILAKEFAWARYVLGLATDVLRRAWVRIRRAFGRPAPLAV